MTARVFYAYEVLGLGPGPGQYARLVREVDELVREIETMEIRIQPDFAPGVHNTFDLLAGQYKLGIISDTIHTTGRGLRIQTASGTARAGDGRAGRSGRQA